jgi:plasmid stability protein
MTGARKQMAQVTVRNPDEQVVAALRRKAELHGHSPAQALRMALASAARLTSEGRVALTRQIRRLTPASNEMERVERDPMLLTRSRRGAVWFVTAAAATLAVGCAAPVRAETPPALCKRVGTDDTTQPIPEDLVPAANAAFGMRLPARVAVDTTVYRCARGHVMVCTTGANLPCGKANTKRAPSAGMVQWCRDNPDASVVPAAAAGHDAIYAWRCRAGVPSIVRQTLHADPHGFIAEFWTELP